MSRILITIGLVIVAIGILWPWLTRIGVPITSGLIVSILLTAVLWLVYRH
ncbi:hypothetical protein [Ensifer sp. BR816]|nr:hypothetical protein [Ensifer sp. BR816]